RHGLKATTGSIGSTMVEPIPATSSCYATPVIPTSTKVFGPQHGMTTVSCTGFQHHGWILPRLRFEIPTGTTNTPDSHRISEKNCSPGRSILASNTMIQLVTTF